MEKIKTTQNNDLPKLCHCHRAAFPGSVATALGQRYTERMLSWYLAGDKTFLFHIEDGQGRCTGYCGGMISDGTLDTGSASGMAQHTFQAGLWAFATHPWVLFHAEMRSKWPLLWKNVLMKLGLRNKVHFSQEQKLQMAGAPCAGLVVIGVSPAFQGKGYGSLLLREFERRAVEQYGAHRFRLTVRADNLPAIRAYEKNGWIKKMHTSHTLLMVKDYSSST